MKKVKQSTTKRLLALVLCAVSVFAVFAVLSPRTNKASAEESSDAFVAEYAAENNEATPYGIYTNLSLSINGGDGRIWATVRNDFTLFPATVHVIVRLYSSDTFKEAYTDMTLVSSNEIGDLNIGKTIVTEGYTNGVQKYWKAKMEYKIDKGSWETRVTQTLLYDAQGNVVK